jgi:hypothetical protein
MSDPAHAVCLHLLLCDGLSGLSRIVDRLSVVGVVPRSIMFRRGLRGSGFVHLTLDRTQSAEAALLAIRLEQLIPVLRVRLSPSEARPSKTPSS